MQFTDAARASFGFEIEQLGENVPASYRRRNRWSWHRDGSGPMETDIGPYKLPKALLNEFYRGTRDEGHTWEWTAASTLGGDANGHGSHVHFHLCAPDGADRSDKIEAWTIAYNTIVELTPIFAPFFCHDWQRGFRHGTTYPRSSNLNVKKWASPQVTRLSQASVEREVINEQASRSYNSVTLNGGYHKPVTVELRLSDAFPAMAMAGVSILKKIVVACVERGWSVKLDEAVTDKIELYHNIYERAAEFGLIEAMKTSPEIAFLEDRGVPRVDELEFDNMWDLLDSILDTRHPKAGSYKRRAIGLVQTGDDANSPFNNPADLWHMDAEPGDFSWSTADIDTE